MFFDLQCFFNIIVTYKSTEYKFTGHDEIIRSCNIFQQFHSSKSCKRNDTSSGGKFKCDPKNKYLHKVIFIKTGYTDKETNLKRLGCKRKNGILLPKLFWPTVRKKCSSDRKKLLKFEAEGQEFAKFLRSLEQFSQTQWKVRTIFGNRMLF